MKKGGHAQRENIERGNVQQLMRSKKQIMAKKYQIVAVPAYGMLSESDRKACKTMQSLDVTMINRMQRNG